VKGDGFISGGWLNDDRRGKQMNDLMHVTDWYGILHYAILLVLHLQMNQYWMDTVN